jgi:Ni/Co efflux regulator RcnB
MRRIFAFAAIFALALPSLASAQNPQGNKGGAHPPARSVAPHAAPFGNGPVVHGPVVQRPIMRGPVGNGPVHVERQHRDFHVGGPGPGPRGAPFMLHGHEVHRVHFARPWVYPPGWGYRRWAVGAVLPALFLVPAYYYADWESVGLSPPPPGFQWVQYGPDLLLVNVTTGEVVDVAYGVFY